MAKYRIVAREGRYFAQKKWFGCVWVDLSWISLPGYGNWPAGGENASRQLEMVENFVEMYRDRYNQNKVVREYE